MQARGRFIELHLPDMVETEAGLTVDAKQLWGPIGRVESIGDQVSMDFKLELGDWVVFNPDLLRNWRIKGTIRNFVVDGGIVATLSNEEVDAPVLGPKLIIEPKDAIEVN